MAAGPSGPAIVSAQEKDLPVAGAPRGEHRPPDKAQPQNGHIAVLAARVPRAGRGRGTAEKNENWRLRHGGSSIRAGDALGPYTSATKT